MGAIALDYGGFILHSGPVDVSERVRALAAVAREVGAVRVRHGDLELELGPVARQVVAEVADPKAEAEARDRIKFAAGAGMRRRLPMAG